MLSRLRITTGSPAETLGLVVGLLRRSEVTNGPLSAIGLASFGRIAINRSSPEQGTLLETSKAQWTGTSMVAPLFDALDAPLGLDTNVNAAALGGRSLVGVQHEEVGHLVPPRHPRDTVFPGYCPYHGSCLEGLVSGPAILAR